MSIKIKFKLPFIVLGLIANLQLLIGQNEIFINEFQASNFSTIADSDFSVYSDWIEIYNDSDEAIDIGGYYLTDDLQNNEKWQIPSNTYIPGNGYLIFWCDNQDVILNEFHTNFKLSSGGEEIGLLNQSLILVDSVTFVDQVEDASFGRKPDGSTTWKYFADPTPCSSNSNTGYNTNEQAGLPDFSLLSGFFSSPESLSISAAGSNIEIRYTTDGSQPDLNSELFTGALPIISTVVIRARTFSDNLLPSGIVSHSYFVNEETSLPVISLIMNSQFLWDSVTGIYVDDNIHLRRNWERSGTLEYFNADHELDFTIDADLRLFGNTAIYYPQKSLAVFPDNPLDYKLFDAVDTDEFFSFILRSSSDDWPYTMLRDALMHSLIKDHLNIDHQAYTPSVLFINGAYFGIHNIREKFNERYLETYHNIDPQNVDIIQIDIRDTTISALEGDLDEILTTLDLIQNNDLSQVENFNMVKNMIDLENYVDYLVANLFFSNTSWHHNVKIWKEKTTDSKWQWLVYDLDRGMFHYYLNTYSVIEDLDTTDLFFPHLNENQEFQNILLNRLSIFMSSVFESERVVHYIDSLINKIDGEIPDHSLRWKDECHPEGYCGIQSLDDWVIDVNGLKGYTDYAQETVRQYMDDFYELDGSSKLTISIENPELGDIFINGIEYPADSPIWTFFKGVPIDLKAVPKNGNIFLEWGGISFYDTLQISLQDDRTITARFGTYCFLPQVVEEDYIVTNECDAYFSQGSLTVSENASLTIQEGVHIFMSSGDSIKVNGQLVIEGTPDYPVVIRAVDENHFWGGIHVPDGNINLAFTEFLNCKNAVTINGGYIEVKNCTVHYSPYYFSDIFSIHFANTILENNLIYGPNDDGKTDVIDCDEISYGNIRNNIIFGTTDDGIDIGTGSANVTVYGNEIYNCTSMGISVGEYSQVQVDRNIVVGCDAGIQVHSEATAYIDHNTLYNNDVSIRCFHYSNQPNSGGNAIVTNSVLSSSQSAVYELYENSTISFDYCLSDTEPLAGEGNINADPLFVDPDKDDFNLQDNSPCIDAGDPFFPSDPEGSRTDIGAQYFNHDSSILERNKHFNIYIYPNPASHYIKCCLTDTSETIQKIEIYDQQGKILLKRDHINDNIVNINNISGWNGLYYITLVTSDKKKYSSKFIVLNNTNK